MEVVQLAFEVSAVLVLLGLLIHASKVEKKE